MGTATTQHERIVAFTEPSVKGGQVALNVMAADRAMLALSLSPELARDLRDALCRLFPMASPSLTPSPSPSGRGERGEGFAAGKLRPSHKLHTEQLEKYRRVVAAVNGGARWLDAAAEEEVIAANVVAWWSRQKKLDAAHTGKAPILKPSGVLL